MKKILFFNITLLFAIASIASAQTNDTQSDFSAATHKFSFAAVPRPVNMIVGFRIPPDLKKIEHCDKIDYDFYVNEWFPGEMESSGTLLEITQENAGITNIYFKDGHICVVYTGLNFELQNGANGTLIICPFLLCNNDM